MKRRVDSGMVDREPRQAEKGRQDANPVYGKKINSRKLLKMVLELRTEDTSLRLRRLHPLSMLAVNIAVNEAFAVRER